jgi:hypothetical protein
VGTTVLGSRGAQHPSTTPNRHVLRQSDFGGHGKSQFHDCRFRKRRLGVKENSTATQVLSKSGHGPSLEVNRQGQLHFETLRASPFQTMFNTIRICAHRPSLPDPVLESVHLKLFNSIADRTGREVPNEGESISRCKPQEPAPSRPRSIPKFLVLRRFLREPSCPWWLTLSQLTHDQMPSSLAVIPKM